jgi:thiamine-monophosphate kinase
MPLESELIEWIRSQQNPSALVQLAAGDDLAVLKWKADDLLLVGVDQVLDGVHFDSAVHPPRSIGRKAMNRNLSDCAAMACLPAAAVASVAIPRGVSMEYARELYHGIKEAGEKFDCPIVGGETGAWDGKLVVTVSILGRSAGYGPITRAGARRGDSICVTGPLGGSLLGRHMEFTPQVHTARLIARDQAPSAMIDLSDGISRDLRQICEQSRVGAVIDASKIPIHDDAVELSRRDGRPPLEHAPHDGEDHELLYTTTRDGTHWRIGLITAEPGIWLVHPDGRREPLEARGWNHTF